jgi:hypothetical protein
MADQATMTLPMDLIKPAIEAKVNAAVMEAMGERGMSVLIEKLVAEIMTRKVDDNGKVNSSSYCNTVPWLSWAVRSTVEETIKETIVKHIADHQDAIKSAIEAEMRKSKSPLVQSLVSAMASGLAATCSQYRVNVEFKNG